MTQKRKRVYISILLCATLAVCVDRFAVGYVPDIALASTVKISPEAASVLPIKKNEVIRSIPELPFPRFVKASIPGEFVDYFMPPSLRNRQPVDGSSERMLALNKDQQVKEGGIDYMTFESTYTLDAVMLSPKFRVAIINGRWVQFGQDIDGCKLIEISDNITRFDCTDGIATLRVINISSLLHD